MKVYQIETIVLTFFFAPLMAHGDGYKMQTIKTQDVPMPTIKPASVQAVTLPTAAQVARPAAPGEYLIPGTPTNNQAKDAADQSAFDAFTKALQGMGSGAGGSGSGSGTPGKGSAGAGQGSSGGGTGSAGAADSASAPAGGDGNIGTGDMESCGTLPPSVSKALDQAKTYRASCKMITKSADSHFAINDYSTPNSPYMYIFNDDGSCKARTAVTYGMGSSGPAVSGAQLPCAGGSEHYTPAGFHITQTHGQGAKYGPSNSLIMAGLEGQGSAGRGILIHGAESPGTMSSFGCSGVGQNCLQTVMELLKPGSLVYNYFGDKSAAPGCSNNAGLGDKHDGSTCHPDSGKGSARAVDDPSVTTGR